MDDPTPPFALDHDEREVSAEACADLPERSGVGHRIAARYVGEDRAEELGRRNAVPGDVLVRPTPANVVSQSGMFTQPRSAPVRRRKNPRPLPYPRRSVRHNGAGGSWGGRVRERACAGFGMLQEVDHPAGTIKMLASPMLVDGEHLPTRYLSPTPGQHTDESDGWPLERIAKPSYQVELTA